MQKMMPFNNHRCPSSSSSSIFPNRQRTSSTTTSGPGRHPNYAIVTLPEGTNALRFYQLLLENGFPEVSFVNEVRENAFLPSKGGGNHAGGGSNHHQNSTQQQSILAGAPTAATNSSSSMAAALEEARILLRQQAQSSSSSPSPSSTAKQQQQLVAQVQLHQRTTLPPLAAMAPSKQSTQTIIISSSSPHSSSPASAAPSPATIERSTMNPPVPAKNNDEFATCLLCNNRIMSSRLSNLTNHVRRHASLKQYRCCHCQYAHNEMAKVRLHMAHNHHDFDSQPMDQMTFEMQLQWGLLMEQCFPDHAKRFGPSAANSQFRCLDQLQKCVDLERSFACIECGELVQGYRLVNHLEDTHRADCAPSACSECGYQSCSQWKVRLHISVKHAERAAEVAVEQKAPGTNPMLFLNKFFSEVQIPWLDEEEANLVAELREKNAENGDGEQQMDNGRGGEDDAGGGEEINEPRVNLLEDNGPAMENTTDDEPVMDQNGEELKEEKMKASRQTTVMLKEEPRERGPEEGNGHRGDHDAAIDGNADSKGTMKQRQLPLEKSHQTRKRENSARPTMHPVGDEEEEETGGPDDGDEQMARKRPRQSLRQSHRIMQMNKQQQQQGRGQKEQTTTEQWTKRGDGTGMVPMPSLRKK